MRTPLLKMLLLMALILPATASAFSQAKILEGVLSLRLRNTGPIVQNNLIRGYYMFYLEDKVDRKTNAYQLRILDQDLNEVGKESIVGSRHLYLLEGAYNGESIMMKFYDASNKTVTLQRFGLDGKLIEKIPATVAKYEEMMYTQYMTEEVQGTNLFAIPGQGYVHYRTVKNKKIGYAFDFLPEKGKGKKWTMASPTTSSEFEMAGFLGYHGGLILSTVMRKRNLMSPNFDTFILATEAETGKKRYEVAMTHNEFEIAILNAVESEVNGPLHLLGLYFKHGDNWSKDPSLGFCRVSLDPVGNITETKFVSWGVDVAKLLPVNQKGKIDGSGYVFFHKLVTDDKGDVFLIGEQYKKTVSGLGVAANVLNGGGSSNFQLTVDNMIFFHLSPEFELAGIDIFEKSKTRVQLPPGAGINGPQLLALYMKSYGAFDYSFTQQTEDKSRFTVGFIDWDKESKVRDKTSFGAITWVDGGYSTDKISLATDASSISLQPGKPGYVVLFEYFRKEKKLEIRLEQVNF